MSDNDLVCADGTFLDGFGKAGEMYNFQDEDFVCVDGSSSDGMGKTGEMQVVKDNDVNEGSAFDGKGTFDAWGCGGKAWLIRFQRVFVYTKGAPHVHETDWMILAEWPLGDFVVGLLFLELLIWGSESCRVFTL